MICARYGSNQTDGLLRKAHAKKINIKLIYAVNPRMILLHFHWYKYVVHQIKARDQNTLTLFLCKIKRTIAMGLLF